MLTQHIALVPEAGGVDLSELARVSAALQKQVTRDFAPVWGLSATVDAFHALEDVPVGYWPIILSAGELTREAGLHLDGNGQPYAQIGATALWSFQASRACLELLVNPFGDRTTTGSSPRPDQGPVEFLVEVAAPCAARAHGYAIDGVFVADFCTPAFYGASMAAGRRDPVSFNGALRGPFQVLSGGYLTWHDSTSNSWWMRIQPGQTSLDIQLGSVSHAQICARSLAQERGPDRGWGGSGSSRALESNLRRLRDQTFEASQLRALRLRSLLGQRLQESLAPAPYPALEHAGSERPESAIYWEEPVESAAALREDAAPLQTSMPTLRGPAVPPPYPGSERAPAAEVVVALPPPPRLPTRVAADETRPFGHSSSMPSRAAASLAPHPIERDRLWIGLSAIAAAAVLITVVTRGVGTKAPASVQSAVEKPTEEAPRVDVLSVPETALAGVQQEAKEPRATTLPSAMKPVRTAPRSQASASVAGAASKGEQPPASPAESTTESASVPTNSLDDLIETRR